MDLAQLYSDLLSFLFTYGPKVIGAILVWLIGSWVIKLLIKGLKAVFQRTAIDASLRPFLLSLAGVGLRLLLAISVLGMLGIQMTSFIAILGAAGLAVGMALSGTLQNFAGGVMLLLFKPISVGDLIESQGYLGVVKEIQIFVTVLLTPENKTVILPNGAVANGEITNYATEGNMRVDLIFGIGYSASIDQAKAIFYQLMQEHEKVLQDPAPFVGVLELGDSSVNLAVRPYAKPEDYWAVYFDLYEQGKKALDKAGIEIPFPQQVIHRA